MSVRPLTAREVAAELSIDERTLRRWQNASWFPMGARTPSGWDVDAIAAARDAHGLKGSEISSELAAMRLQALRIQVSRAENRLIWETEKLREQQSQLFPRGAVVMFHAAIVEALVNWERELPACVARFCPASHRQAIQRELVQNIQSMRIEIVRQLEARLKEWDGPRQDRHVSPAGGRSAGHLEAPTGAKS